VQWADVLRNLDQYNIRHCSEAVLEIVWKSYARFHSRQLTSGLDVGSFEIQVRCTLYVKHVPQLLIQFPPLQQTTCINLSKVHLMGVKIPV
jgi:hypothetical protein